MTFQIEIPMTVRSAVRSMVRNHPGFEAFRLRNGDFASRDLNHTRTMQAIEEFGLEAAVTALVEAAPAPAPRISPTSPLLSPEDIAPAPVSPAPAPEGSGFTADSVLDKLRPYLSPVLVADVASALEPIVSKAHAVPETVTVETIKYVDESGAPVAAPVIAVPDAKRAGKTTLGKAFGLPRFKHSGQECTAWDSVSAPAIDVRYVFDGSVLARLLTAIEGCENVWLAGPASSGKSTLPEQVAARLYRPCVTIAFNRAVEPIDLIGQYVFQNGSMVWRDGILLEAIRKPGTIIVLDEITFAPPGILATLQTLLASRFAQVHATGERVTCADGVTFVAADNTAGYGDTGLYAGTMIANAALVDRFARLISMGYMEADLEAQALANHTGAPHVACKRLVDAVASARGLAGFDNRPMGLRRMIGFVRMVQQNFTVAEAFEDTFYSRLPDADRETLKQHFRVFMAADFLAELTGQAVAAPVSPAPAPGEAPENARAQNVFSAV